jgi:hypothetical protein
MFEINDVVGFDVHVVSFPYKTFSARVKTEDGQATLEHTSYSLCGFSLKKHHDKERSHFTNLLSDP